MLQANPSLREEMTGSSGDKNAEVSPLPFTQPTRARTSEVSGRQTRGPELVRASHTDPDRNKAKVLATFHSKVPVIIGEAAFTGNMPVNGLLLGHLGTNGGTHTIKQRISNGVFDSPELDGELTFNEMLRVNGFIAGTVCSQKGTLIVDSTARVDANVEVAVAVIGGIVNGDIIAHQRVEVGPEARINGNIWTQSLAIQPGAVFEGVCRMLQNTEPSK
ncbi:MAG: polymer-forming cytoskeletal protein [Pyrinomonadaceae bacterium]